MTKDEALEILEENLRRAKINDSIGYDRQERKAHNNYKEFLTVSIEALKAQKFGKWNRLKVAFMPYPYAYECSVCREWGNIETFDANYCPNCGAKMEGRDYGSK